MGYWRASLSPAYNFFLAVVLLGGYEGLLWLAPEGSSHSRNLIDLWIQSALRGLLLHRWVLSLVIVLLGLAYVYGIRRNRERLFGWVFLLMLVESVAWALVIWQFLPLLIRGIGASIAQLGLSHDTLHSIALCLGAGFYEELFFRVFLVEGLLWLFTGFRYQKVRAVHIMMGWLVSALIFSGLHFVQEPFSWYAFVYRGVFGLIMSGVYLLRGFAIPAWAHALYDVAVLWL